LVWTSVRAGLPAGEVGTVDPLALNKFELLVDIGYHAEEVQAPLLSSSGALGGSGGPKQMPRRIMW
jgi:hypothetical protein